jgi:hypothetical protein
MSTFQEQWVQYAQPQLYVDPHAFTFNQYGMGREKTPTDSLINHPRFSPGPLTATPPASRNPSQPPEALRDQPDHMLWDDGSISNSPTSVRTPDGESFEVDMLEPEVRNYYQHNGMEMSNQESHNPVAAVDHSIMFTSHGTFSDHGMFVTTHSTLSH